MGGCRSGSKPSAKKTTAMRGPPRHQHVNSWHQAPGGGIEPPLTDSKSAVLPLDDPGMGVVPRGLFAFWPLSSPGCAPRMPRQTPRSALSGASTVCRARTLFQTVSGRVRREHTPHRYRSIGVGPRYSQAAESRISLVDNMAHLLPHLALSNARIHPRHVGLAHCRSCFP